MRESYPSLYALFLQVFDEIILAGAFKGANGVSKTFLDTQRYLQNLHSYYQLYSKFQHVSYIIPHFLKIPISLVIRGVNS